MHDLLKKLKKSKVKIDLVEDKLDIQAPKGVMTSVLLSEIKLHKDALVAFIRLHKSKQEQYATIPRLPEQESYEISSSQRRLWLLQQMEAEASAYNMPSVFELRGNIDVACLQKAFVSIIRRHQSLRTIFKEDEKGEVRQVIVDEDAIKFELQYEEIFQVESADEKVRKIVAEELKYSFDLSKDSLLRAKLLKINEEQYVLIWVMHHIINDGQSSQIMREELFLLYDGYTKGEEIDLPELAFQYRDYASWQQSMLQSEEMENSRKYWHKQFSGELPILDLLTYQTRPAIKSYRGKTIEQPIAEQEYKLYKQLCQGLESTVFMGMVAIVKILLHRYTHQSDIVIGSPIAGRSHADLENQIGLYINTIALRSTIEGEDSFKDVLSKIKQITLGAYEHEMYPYDELVEQLSLNRDRSRNPLFDVMLTYEKDKARTENLRIEKLEIQEYKGEEEVTSKFDIDFAFEEKEENLHLRLTYNTDLYTEDFMQRIFGHLEILMKNIISKPEEKIGQLNYLTESEQHQLLIEFNDTKVPYPEDKTIIDLFEEQVEKTPDAIAVVFEDVELSYKELNEKANRLGKYLNGLGDLPGTNIVLCFDSHLEKAIICILATWKLGATYIPVDPDYPNERIQYIINNASANFVLTTSDDAPLNLDPAIKIVYLDEADTTESEGIEKENINQSKSNESAYVIYTSGTTGSPKGVLVSHQNIVDYLFGLSAKINIEENKSFGLMSTISTDLGNTVLFSALIFGRKIHLFSKNRLRDIEYIQSYFSKNEIDCIKIVPSYWNSLGLESKHRSPSKMIIFGGEQLSAEVVKKIKKEKQEVKIINHYGPTETTIGKLLHIVDPHMDFSRIPIGKAFSNTQLYIVDGNLSLCSIGVKGELLIGGDGVSQGYLNNDSLTNEKFIENIFVEDGSKLYRTGDLVILQADGNIEFKSRIDKQVKILGHRIELLEIENALNKIDSIQASVVNVVETQKGDKKIVAYIVSDKNEIDKNELLANLRLSLPGIMIPSALIQIGEIPFMSNGKINYKSLPGIDETIELKREVILPKNETEQKILSIWKDVLGIENLGVTDNFFEFGGNSLIVGQIINRIYKELNKSISFKAFFLKPTIEEISKKLKESIKYRSIPKVTEAISYPMTSSQQRMWILSQLEGGSIAYNMPIVLKIKGDIKIELFQKCFDNLIRRHEILRTYFKINEENEIRQYVVPWHGINFAIELLDFTDRSDVEIENYLHSVNNEEFDLEKAPILRSCLINTAVKEYLFFFSRHHIISDGWSSQIIISEVLKTYNALVHGEEINLPELSIQYKDYAVWLSNEFHQKKYKEAKQYWLNQFSGELPFLNFPSLKRRPLTQTFKGTSISHTFSKIFFDKIKLFSKENDVTLFMILMAGINTLLYRYTDQDDIIIGTPIAGREHPELENQLGLYLNTLAIRTKINGETSFLDLVIKQKEILLEAYENQCYSFDELVGNLNLKRNANQSTLFDVMIVLQNHHQLNILNKTKELSGLRVEEYDLSKETTQFDINFIFIESERLELSIEYKSEIYDSILIERIFEHFENIISEALTQSKISLNKLDYLSDLEKQQLLNFNNTETSYLENKTVMDLFEEQVDKYPNNIAVIYEDISLTYKKLNEISNQFAFYLKAKHDIKPNDIIGVEIENSDKTIIALLGILKSGAGYFTINSDFTQERIDAIVNDNRKLEIIDMEEFEAFVNVIDKYPIENIENDNKSSDIVYITHSSKNLDDIIGIPVVNKSLVNLISSIQSKPSINSNDVLLSTTRYTSNSSFIEFFAPLLTGASLFILNQNVLSDPLMIIKKIDDIQPTIIHSTPKFYKKLIDAKWDINKKLRIWCGGDILTESLINKLLDNTEHVWNLYGSLETAIYSCIKKVENPELGSNIGRPIQNTCIYILDKNQCLTPVGVEGEIHIGGIAIEYSKKEIETRGMVIKSPFDSTKFIYKTGDYGKWNTEGDILFLHRKGKLIKISDNWIDLAKIESAVKNNPQIDDAVVIAKKDIEDNYVLICYYTASINEIEISNLKFFLKFFLPEYMLPDFFISLNNSLNNSDEKINEKYLPSIDVGNLLQNNYIAPCTKEEKVMVSVWEKVLKRESISIKDNYYNLGGDSIKSIQIVSQLKQKGYALKIQHLLQVPILEELVKYLVSETQKADQSTITGEVKLTPIQIYFFENSKFKEHNYFNQSVVLKSNKEIDLNFLRTCINLLLGHHDALRMVYRKDNNKWHQFNQDKLENQETIIFHDLRGNENELEEMQQLGEALQSGFNLEEGPLFKVGFFRLNDGDRLALIIHHLVVDGVSWRILLEDISTLYSQHVLGETLQLPFKSDSFQRWSELQNKYAQDEKMQAERIYWKKICSRTVPAFYRDKGFEEINIKHDAVSSFTLDNSTSNLLKTKVHGAYKTEINDILLTALALAINEVFNLSTTTVIIEGHGREEIINDIDISRTVGWFTSIYPIILETKNLTLPTDVLIEVKEMLRKIPNKGIGFGMLKYLTDRAVNYNIEQSIQFNYYGDFDNTQLDKDNSQFEFTDESIGSESSFSNTDNILMTVSGMMVRNELTMSVEYSKKIFFPETVQKFIDSYKKILTGLIYTLSEINENHLTPSDLSFKKISIDRLSKIISDNPIEDIYKLSPLQQGFYYHWLTDQSSAMFFEQVSFRIKYRNLNIKTIKETFNTLVLKHGVLRTSFTFELYEEPLQIVRKGVSDNFKYHKITDESLIDTFLEEVKIEDRSKGFNLSEPSQIRLQVIEIKPGEYEFIWSNHHIILDGWSMNILVNDFFQILNSIKKQVPINPSKYRPFSDYIKWLEKIDKAESLSYWSEYLKGYEDIAEIPFKKDCRVDDSYIENKESLLVEGELYEGINNICTQIGITQYTYLQAVWGYLLSQYNNNQDVVFGSVVSGRPHELEDVESMIGMFINTIPVRIKYDKDQTVQDLLIRLQKDTITSINHHYMNLSEVQRLSKLGNNLINHVLLFLNYPTVDVEQDDNQEVKNGPEEEMIIESVDRFKQTNYDFSITIIPLNSSLKIDFISNKNIYDTKLMESMISHFTILLKQFSQNINIPLNQIEYITEEERNQVLFGFNKTEVKLSQDKTIIDIFEQQVLKTPDKIAVMFEDVELTYKEVNAQSNQMAFYLREKHSVKAGDLIGIKLNRSEKMIVAILGILKSGAAYIPIDPDYPEERVVYIENDSRSKAIIDEAEIQLFYNIRTQYSSKNISRINKAEDLAYVIYTSGTTGNPKGVMVEHLSLLNRLNWMQKAYSLCDDDTILQKTSYSFDVSVWELLWWVYNGSKVCLLKPGGQKDPGEIINHIEKYKVSVLHFVPSMLTVFLEYLDTNKHLTEKLMSVKQVFVSGEALSSDQNNKFFKQFLHASLMNLYGPTEATIDVSYYKCTKDQTIIPIGKPIDNIQLYILNNDLRPVPIGVIGKLYISGVGVSRGYLNKQELTLEKFIFNPFIDKKRMYDTGDICRWLPGGNIEFLGRKDHQVKIRGYRIELGEIESAIFKFSKDIRQIVVEAKELNKERVLVAYLVSSQAIDKSELKDYLMKLLPNYMVPNFYSILPELPLSSNGKIDRKSLPGITGEEISREYFVLPRNTTEENLIIILQEVLGINKIGVTDNFFDLGGNSLNVMLFASKIVEKYGYKLDFPTFFNTPTIEFLSEEIQKSTLLSDLTDNKSIKSTKKIII